MGTTSLPWNLVLFVEFTPLTIICYEEFYNKLAYTPQVIVRIHSPKRLFLPRVGGHPIGPRPQDASPAEKAIVRSRSHTVQRQAIGQHDESTRVVRVIE